MHSRWKKYTQLQITFTFFKQYVATYNNLILPIKSEKAEVAKIIFYCCIHPVNLMYPSRSSWEQNLRIKITCLAMPKVDFHHEEHHLFTFLNNRCNNNFKSWTTNQIKGKLSQNKNKSIQNKYIFNFSWNNFYVIFFLINDYISFLFHHWWSQSLNF